MNNLSKKIIPDVPTVGNPRGITPGYGYRFLKPGETWMDTDEFWCGRWRSCAGLGCSVVEEKNALGRRKIDAGNGYRLLAVGEVLEPTDEMRSCTDTVWAFVVVSGYVVRADDPLLYRRKVEAPKPKLSVPNRPAPGGYRWLNPDEKAEEGDEYYTTVTGLTGSVYENIGRTPNELQTLTNGVWIIRPIVTALKKQLAEQRETNRKLDADNQSLKRDNDALRQDLERLNKAYDDLDEQKHRLIAGLEKRVKELTQEVNTLRSKPNDELVLLRRRDGFTMIKKFPSETTHVAIPGTNPLAIRYFRRTAERTHNGLPIFEEC